MPIPCDNASSKETFTTLNTEEKTNECGTAKFVFVLIQWPESKRENHIRGSPFLYSTSFLFPQKFYVSFPFIV